MFGKKYLMHMLVLIFCCPLAKASDSTPIDIPQSIEVHLGKEGLAQMMDGVVAAERKVRHQHDIPQIEKLVNGTLMTLKDITANFSITGMQVSLVENGILASITLDGLNVLVKNMVGRQSYWFGDISSECQMLKVDLGQKSGVTINMALSPIVEQGKMSWDLKKYELLLNGEDYAVSGPDSCSGLLGPVIRPAVNAIVNFAMPTIRASFADAVPELLAKINEMTAKTLFVPNLFLVPGSEFLPPISIKATPIVRQIQISQEDITLKAGFSFSYEILESGTLKGTKERELLPLLTHDSGHEQLAWFTVPFALINKVISEIFDRDSAKLQLKIDEEVTPFLTPYLASFPGVQEQMTAGGHLHTRIRVMEKIEIMKMSDDTMRVKVPRLGVELMEETRAGAVTLMEAQLAFDLGLTGAILNDEITLSLNEQSSLKLLSLTGEQGQDLSQEVQWERAFTRAFFQNYRQEPMTRLSLHWPEGVNRLLSGALMRVTDESVGIILYRESPNLR